MEFHPCPKPKPGGGIGQKRSKRTRLTRDQRLILSPADRTKQRKRLWKKRPHICEICNTLILSIEEMELDHEEPKGLGGGTRDDSDENQRLTHIICNRLKGSKRFGAVVEAQPQDRIL